MMRKHGVVRSRVEEREKPTWKVERVKVLVVQSCLTLRDPKNSRPPGSSVHGILQARRLEWVAILLSRGVFLTQGLKLGLPHFRQILYCLSHQVTLWKVWMVIIITEGFQIGNPVTREKEKTSALAIRNYRTKLGNSGKTVYRLSQPLTKRGRMNRNDHGMVYIILAKEDRRTKKTVGMYQADLSPWTRLKSYKLPLLVAWQ